MIDIGIEPDNRKFVPQLTLAHLRGLSSHDVMVYVSQYNLFQPETFNINRFVLISSHMKRGGSDYTIENTYSLGLTDPSAKNLNPS